jgi:AbrB family looped-hinge helix DNA binding protein
LKEPTVTAVKIGTSRQIIIPKKAFEELGLAGGDYLDVTVRNGSLVMSPKTLVDKPARHDDVADDTQRMEEQ